jgi:hypothetical protein
MEELAMKRITIAAIGLLITGGPAFAHHPFDSEFDANAAITIQGKITGVEWQTPHVIVKVETNDDQGVMKTWDLEAASPDEMTKMGWTEAMLKIGDTVSAQGYKSKTPTSTVVAARSIELPDGKKMLSHGDDAGPTGEVQTPDEHDQALPATNPPNG